ncbi:hypothetical protein PVAP13_3NG155600 [Panicum virgatum]|uniref:Uncharacterized protein n=1 Tax=Panicum virgatum TaxID=38727 RepID=A0A8T0UBY4_PANVG|nr:hypothetical protein PVAP13_3NG155600 [Panicum virgatum]
MAEAGASRSSPAATTRCSSGPCVGLWRCAVVRWRRKLGSMAGRDVLHGRRWRRVGAGTAAAQGGWEGRGMARVMLGAGAACVPTSGVRGGKAAVAWLSGKEREDGGDARPEEVLTVVCTGTAVGPCVGPRDGARGDAMRCGQTVDLASVLSWCGGALFWPGSSGVCPGEDDEAVGCL